MTEIFLYNNSQIQGKQGFIVSKARGKYQVKTTIEFAFAKTFSCHQDAIKWRDKYHLAAVPLLRVADSITE